MKSVVQLQRFRSCLASLENGATIQESKDNGYLRASQPVSREKGCEDLFPQSSRVRASLWAFESYLLYCKTTCFPWKNEGSEATLTTHWTTHQVPRQRTRRRSMCKHARAWTCRKAKAIGQICEKPWGNQGFAAERTGFELLAVFPMFLESSKGTF